jgi:hypothetical protein
MGTFLFLGALAAQASFQPAETEGALKGAGRAYYKQSGLAATLEAYEREAVPHEVRIAVGNAALVARTLVERRIQVTWRFP